MCLVFFFNFYLFIFYCPGSSFLLRLFSSFREQSGCGGRGAYSLVAVHRLLIAVASPVEEHEL